MRFLSTLFILLLFLCPGAFAHEGMIALFADEAASDCDAAISPSETVNLYLFYVRGNGPEMGSAYEFMLSKSSAGVIFGTFVLPPNTLHIGTIEEGISVTFYENVFPGEGLDALYLGSVPVININETGTFTVSVVDDPTAIDGPGIYITLYVPDVFPIYRVIGGTFVFNGSCSSPENPTEITATKASSWGAIKNLCR